MAKFTFDDENKKSPEKIDGKSPAKPARHYKTLFPGVSIETSPNKANLIVIDGALMKNCITSNFPKCIYAEKTSCSKDEIEEISKQASILAGWEIDAAYSLFQWSTHETEYFVLQENPSITEEILPGFLNHGNKPKIIGLYVWKKGK